MPIYKDTRGYYYFSVLINGERKLRRRTLKGERMKTRKSALTAEREFLLYYDSGEFKELSFYELYELWIYHRRQIWKQTTCFEQESRFKKHIKDEFKDISCSILTQVDFNSWRKRIGEKDISTGYKNFVLNAFKNLWQYAEDFHQYRLQNNYAKRLMRFKATEFKQQSTKITYNIQQFLSLISQIKDFRVLIFLSISYLTGTRVSETLGLKIRNYDHEKATLLIDHQTTNKLGIGRVMDITLKTETSHRTIYLPQWINNLIYKYLDTHPDKANPEAYLIYSSKNGLNAPLSANSIRREINRASEVLNLPQIDLRELRTSFATLASDLDGVELKTISTAMGHATITTTSKYYDQSGKKHLKELAEAIDKALSENLSLYQECIKFP